MQNRQGEKGKGDQQPEQVHASGTGVGKSHNILRNIEHVILHQVGNTHHAIANNGCLWFLAQWQGAMVQYAVDMKTIHLDQNSDRDQKEGFQSPFRSSRSQGKIK